MTTGETLIPPATTARRLHEWIRRIGAWAAFSERTPGVVALIGTVLVTIVVGSTVLTKRLEEMAADRIQARLIAGSAPAPVIRRQVLDFTLAPEEVRALDEDAARAFNAAIPFSTLPILAARPFIMAPDKIEDYARALDCLTAAVYFEAGGETAEGQAAVAQVVLNRMRHPAYPRTVCGVVFQGAERMTGCQFSFTCDGAMARPRSVEGWARARASAAAALNGSVAVGVGMATHYHTDWVAPYWAERLVKMRQIGAHIFYRWGGAWGLPGAFTGRHAGAEPVVARMAALVEPVPTLDPIEVPAVMEVVEPLHVTTASVVLPEAAPVVVAPVETPPVAEAPPPAPSVMANPMTSVATVVAPPRRRSRLATPTY